MHRAAEQPQLNVTPAARATNKLVERWTQVDATLRTPGRCRRILFPERPILGVVVVKPAQPALPREVRSAGLGLTVIAGARSHCVMVTSTLPLQQSDTATPLNLM
jgi:hypothetical protein